MSQSLKTNFYSHIHIMTRLASCPTHIWKKFCRKHVTCGINNHKAFFFYTMQNMQNSQLPCFIPSISLKPFLHVASPSAFPLFSDPTLLSPALLCSLYLGPSFAILKNFVVFQRVSPLILPFLFHFHLSSDTLFSSFPSYIPCETPFFHLSHTPSPCSVKAVHAIFF